MRTPEKRADIYSSDFDGFVSEVTADIWNKLVHTPPFQTLTPKDYPGLFEVVAKTLTRYYRDRQA